VRTVVTAALLFGAFTATASAQTAAARFEVGGGVRWIGGVPLGSSPATETRPGGDRFPLFGTSSRLDAGAGIDTRAGVRLTNAIQIEAALSYRRPTLTTEIASDAEGIPDAEAVEQITEVLVEGALLVHPPWRIGARLEPFLAAGGGYVRQLHEGRALVEAGRTYFVGGGVRVAFAGRDGSRRKGVGLRADARAVLNAGGVSFDDRAHVGGAVGASVFLRF
jgi:hypothetical protein